MEDVAKNIVERAKQRELGDLKPGEIKTALVVQGGVLKGIASCGASMACDRLGLTNAFDAVYGSSSGALNAAYFLTKQSALGVTVYVDDVNNRRVLNLLRFWRMIDLDFLFEDIVSNRKRHDSAALLDHPTELFVVVTNLDTGEPERVNDFETPATRN